jgi:hypothetical protein
MVVCRTAYTSVTLWRWCGKKGTVQDRVQQGHTVAMVQVGHRLLVLSSAQMLGRSSLVPGAAAHLSLFQMSQESAGTASAAAPG